MNDQEIKEIFVNFNFDWKHVYASPGGDSWLSREFEINPEGFLSFAEKDIASNDLRGFVNATTNAKRAIDCQIDKVMCCFGYDPNGNLPENARNYIDAYQRKNGNINATQKLKLLQALDITPSTLVSSMRDIRNKLEHHYKAPTKKDASHFIDFAKLFIRSSDYILKLFPDEWHLFDGENKKIGTNIIAICYEQKLCKFALQLNRLVAGEDRKGAPVVKPQKVGEVIVAPNDANFLDLVALNVANSMDGAIEEPLFRFINSIYSEARREQFAFEGYTDSPMF